MHDGMTLQGLRVRRGALCRTAVHGSGTAGEVALGVEFWVFAEARLGLPTRLSWACGGLHLTRDEGRRGEASCAMHADGAGAGNSGCGK